MDALTLFGLANPEAAAHLGSCDQIPHLVSCRTQLNETNLCDSRSGAAKYLYDQSGALESAFRWRQQFSLYKIDLFVVFGVGLGYEWQALKPWLDSDSSKRVIFVEDDLAILHHFLEQPHAQEMLLHPQTRLYYIDDDKLCKHVSELIAWNHFNKKQLFAPSVYYQATRPKSTKKVDQKLRLFWNQIDEVLGEFTLYGGLQFRNFFRNIDSFKKARFGSDLFHKFKGMPAIVVGAGPSLESCYDEIRRMQDSALIISGGTATNALLEAGIRPHFCVAVDPNPAQYSRLKQIQTFGIPMFYQTRVLPEGIANYAGELLYLRGGNGQPLIEWIDKEIGIHGPLVDGGHSVANMSVELAHRLGCSPIIMVGYDLSYPGGRLYPTAVKEALSAKESQELSRPITSSFQAVGNDGSEVSTEEKWIVEGTWILKYAEAHPGMKLINTSMEGLRLGHVPCTPFSKMYEQYGRGHWAVRAKVHTEIMKAREVPFSQEKFFMILEKIATSIERCIQLLPGVLTKDPLSVDAWEQELVYKHFIYAYKSMFEKKEQMARLFHEIEFATTPGAVEEFEKRAYEEKIQFFVDGLPILGKRLREYSAQSSYEGNFPTKESHIQCLDPVTAVPEYLL